MAFTADDLARLKAAYAKGVTSLTLGNGEAVTFVSGAEMLARIRVIEAELAGLSRSGGFSVGYANTGRGL